MSETAESTPPTFLNPTVVKYELERFSASIIFDPSIIASIKAERGFYDHQTGKLTERLIGIVATWRAERLLKTPANWWEHIKQRWYPRWALKRWPVLYEWHDAAVILPRVPVVQPSYHTVEFPVWRKHL